MSYKINVLDPSLAVVGEIENIKSAEIYEVINNQYVADVEIAENTFPSFLYYPNILEIDGDYFIIADIDKQRGSSKSINLSLEHVSYLLNDPFDANSVAEDQEEEYTGTILEVVNNLWGGMDRFTIITEITDNFLYRPGTTGGRSRIQEFARQNGFEVEYNKFNIIIHHKRGSNKGLELRVGKNVKSVTQKISLNDAFYVEYAHEVDIIDFSKMPVKYHEDIASADIGDTVRIIDTDLAIDATERIVAKRYSPLFKEVPKISVGQVIRDIVDVINKEEEEEEKDDPTANYFLSTFKVGKVDCLKLSGIEMDFESVLPDDVSTGVDYLIQGEHKGVSIALKSQYSNYYATVTKFYEDGSYNDFNLSSANMQSWNLPEKNLIALTVTVSQVPWNEVDLDVHKAAVYGVTFNKVYIDPLREFKVGKENILKLNPIIDVEGQELYQEDFSTSLKYSITQEHKGMKLSLNKEFKDYKVYITLYDEEFNPAVYDYDTVKEKMSTWNFPNDKVMYVTVTVQEKPNGEFNKNIHKSVMYGVVFEYKQIEPLREFKVGNENVLTLNPFIETEGQELQEDDFHTILNYSMEREYHGLKLSLNREFKDYKIYITLYSDKFIPTVHDYDVVKNQLATWNFPNNNAQYLLITVQEKPTGEFNAALHKRVMYGVKFEYVPIDPLREFKIGDEDCLYLEGVMLDEEPALDEYLAEIFYNKNEQYKGLYLSLKREFASYHVGIKTIDKNGASTDYDLSTVQNDIVDWTFPTDQIMYVLITVLEASPTEFNPTMHRRCYYAVKFVEDETPSEPEEPWLSEFVIGDADCLSLSGIMIPNDPTGASDVLATIEYISKLKGISVIPKKEYAGYSIVYTGYTNDFEVAYSDEYLDGSFVEGWDFPNDQTTPYLTITLLEVPLSEFDPSIHKKQIYAIFMKKVKAEPNTTINVFYGFVSDDYLYKRHLKCFRLDIVDNITDFRENYMDDDFYFESASYSDQYYPVRYGLEVFQGQLVQVVDGLITSIALPIPPI